MSLGNEEFETNDEIPEESQSLLGIKGVGPKTAVKLINLGITSAVHLAGTRYQDLASLMSISKKAAKEIVDDAIDKYLDNAIQLGDFGTVAKHQREVVKMIPTGVSVFDKAMNGGVPTEAITIFKGEYESGKSQFCYQLAVNCLKYHKRKVVWIETESGTFKTNRFEEVAKASGLKFENSDIITISSDVASHVQTLFLSYMRVERKVKRENLDVGLFIIDSFSAPFKKDFGPRESLPDRSREETKHLGWLDEFAKNYNCAIVLTSQIMEIPDQGGSLAEMAKSGHSKKMQGGNTVKHGGTYLISLEQKSKIQYEGVIFGSPDVPRTSFRFKLVKQGVRDV